MTHFNALSNNFYCVSVVVKTSSAESLTFLSEVTGQFWKPTYSLWL